MSAIEKPDNSQSMKTLGGIGFAVSILSLFTCWIPCIGAFAAFGAVAGIICCAIAYSSLKKTSGETGLSIAGLIVGVVALLISLMWVGFLTSFDSSLEESFGDDYFDKVKEEIERIEKEGGSIDDTFIDSLMRDDEPVDSFLLELDRIMEEEFDEVETISDTLVGN